MLRINAAVFPKALVKPIPGYRTLAMTYKHINNLKRYL